MNWENRRTTWYDSIKPDPDHTKYKPQPPYTPAELEKRSEMIWKNIRYVKIPKIPGCIRILPREDGQTIFRSVEYIYDRTYGEAEGPKKRSSRNRKVIIGQEVEEILQGWMLPTENYDRFFDREGNPIPSEEKEEAEEKEEENSEKKPEERPSAEKTEAENRTTEKTTEEITTAEKRTEQKPPEPQTKPNETAADDMAQPEESPKPYYHTAPRSKKQTENLLTKLLEEASREMLATNRKRLQTIPEDEMTEEDWMEYDEIQAAEELEWKNARRSTLRDLFSPQYLSIEVQAKKHPDAIASPYKVRKLNQLLTAIIDLYKDTEYAQYLELIEEPERDEQGRILSGMTYSDINILLNAYEAPLNDYDIFR